MTLATFIATFPHPEGAPAGPWNLALVLVLALGLAWGVVAWIREAVRG